MLKCLCGVAISTWLNHCFLERKPNWLGSENRIHKAPLPHHISRNDILHYLKVTSCVWRTRVTALLSHPQVVWAFSMMALPLSHLCFCLYPQWIHWFTNLNLGELIALVCHLCPTALSFLEKAHNSLLCAKPHTGFYCRLPFLPCFLMWYSGISSVDLCEHDRDTVWEACAALSAPDLVAWLINKLGPSSPNNVLPNRISSFHLEPLNVLTRLSSLCLWT